MLKNERKTNTPNNGTVLFALILLIVLVTSAVSLTYLKFFGNVPATNTTTDSSNTVNDNDVNADENIKEIADSINNGNTIRQFATKNIVISAQATTEGIIISYTENGTKTFDFTYDEPNLSIGVDEIDTKEFANVFKVLMMGIQDVLGNQDSKLSENIAEFNRGNVNLVGVSKTKSGSYTDYVIDITKKTKVDVSATTASTATITNATTSTTN